MNTAREFHVREIEDNEINEEHQPMEIEYAFYKAVRAGDLDAVRENCRQNCFTDMQGKGTLSHNSLQNLKYHFIVATALITRQCIEGGMEQELAYRLSDFYILKVDSCLTAESINALHHDMALDYTQRMSLLQKNNIVSKSIIQCTEYVYNHIHDRITINDLANHTGLSVSYLSRLFKKELGMPVSEYIREKKVEKAENLLKYSDYSLIEIANYLAFSSQSHFIQIFTKQTGMTPKKYRDLYFHTTW